MHNNFSRRDFLKLGARLSFPLLFPKTAQALDIFISQISEKEETNLSILSLNCWGLPFTTDKKVRIESIAKEIASGRFDLIGIQELWMQSDWELIYSLSQKNGLEYGYYYYAGALGSGIGIISRYPIVEIDFLKFSVSGKPQNIYQGDYYGGKGVALARLDTPFGSVDFYTTHFIAKYSDQDEYRSHRIAQSIEALQFIKSTSKSEYVILSGDINSEPNTLEYEIITTLGDFIDSFKSFRPNEMGYTVAQSNPLNFMGLNRRIDYIFIHSDGLAYSILKSNVVLEQIPGLDLYYSDHFGITAKINFQDGSQKSINQSKLNKLTTLSKAIESIEGGLKDAKSRKMMHENKSVAGIMAIPLIDEVSKDLVDNDVVRRTISNLTKYLGSIYSFSQIMLAISSTSEEIRAFEQVASYLYLWQKRIGNMNNE